VSTEQRDKAAGEHATTWRADESLSELEYRATHFTTGWDAHAATMPTKEEVLAVIKAPRMHTNMSGDKESFIADAVLALLNKEGD